MTNKKNTTLLILTLLISMISTVARAQSASSGTQTVPHLLNYQTVLMDDNGNLITDSFIDMEFKILDQNGNQLYYESQPGVQVVKSAMNIMIGEGLTPGTSSPTGGIPLSALDPTTGIKSLQVKIGNNQPSDPMEMGMVPYAMYAEEALTVAKDAITSKEIKDGSIKAADLDPTINFSALAGQISESQLPSTVTLDTELNAHINSTTAHPATAITVVGPFTFTQATNLQQILKDLDSNLLNEVANRIISRDNLNTALNNARTGLQANIDTLTSQLQTETTARTAADTTLTTNLSNEVTARTTAVTTLTTNLTNETTARTTADTTLTTNLSNEVTARTTADTTLTTVVGTAQSTANSAASAASAAQSTANTAVSNAAAAQSTANSASSAASAAQSTANSASSAASAAQSTANSKVSKSGDTMTGSLNMGGNNITNVGTVDGVSVSGLNGRMVNLEGGNVPVPFTNVTGQIADTQLPPYFRPIIQARVFPCGHPNPNPPLAYCPATASNAVNLSLTNDEKDCGSGHSIPINFSVTLPSTNYIVYLRGSDGTVGGLVGSAAGGNLYVDPGPGLGKRTTGINVCAPTQPIGQSNTAPNGSVWFDIAILSFF